MLFKIRSQVRAPLNNENESKSQANEFENFIHRKLYRGNNILC